MCGSLVRTRRASISSAGLQWACTSIMAVSLVYRPRINPESCQLSGNLFQPPSLSKRFSRTLGVDLLKEGGNSGDRAQGQAWLLTEDPKSGFRTSVRTKVLEAKI